MNTLTLYYGTNRGHLGSQRFSPTGYGPKFSGDGAENLRFGKVTMQVDQRTVQGCLNRKVSRLGAGDGESLATYLAQRPMTITAYPESLDPTRPDDLQPAKILGSAALFADLKTSMDGGADVLVYIHGYNVSWVEAVAGALALQSMLNRQGRQDVVVVLFTWPSDGQMLPFTSYRSDRTDAKASGYAVGRAFLKFRDFLNDLRGRVLQGQAKPCSQNVHLLCHSMGNYVLQNAIERVAEFCPGTMPRIFTHAFLCAADVDDNVLEPEQPLGRLDEICGSIEVYTNGGDLALKGSDYTKGNADRLGTAGPARPTQVHTKIQHIDCSDLVGGILEHSYYLGGKANMDIAMTITKLPTVAPGRPRKQVNERRWRLA